MASTSVGFGMPVLGTWIMPYTLYMAYLSASVSAVRRATKTPVGNTVNPVTKDKTDDGKPQPEVRFDPLNPDPLYLAIRCHANYVEVIPWCLGVAALAELNGADKTVLNIAMAVLFGARIWHVQGMHAKYCAGIGRKIGAFVSLGFMAGMSVYNAWLSRGWWGL